MFSNSASAWIDEETFILSKYTSSTNTCNNLQCYQGAYFFSSLMHIQSLLNRLFSDIQFQIFIQSVCSYACRMYFHLVTFAGINENMLKAIIHGHTSVCGV